MRYKGSAPDRGGKQEKERISDFYFLHVVCPFIFYLKQVFIYKRKPVSSLQRLQDGNVNTYRLDCSGEKVYFLEFLKKCHYFRVVFATIYLKNRMMSLRNITIIAVSQKYHHFWKGKVVTFFQKSYFNSLC